MHCSEIRELIAGATVVRDGVFENLGMIGDDATSVLVYALTPAYINQAARQPNTTSLLTTPALASQVPAHLGVVTMEDPKVGFFLLHHALIEKTSFYGQERATVIAPSAQVHPSAYVAGSSVVIGERASIGPGVCILERVTIEADVIIRAGTTVGTEGFEFKRVSGGLLPVKHAGGVLVRSGAELQANCTVSKSVFRKPTVIGPDTKIDNLVHIAHNVQIGARCLIAASACLAGSVRLGDEVWVGPGVVISSGIAVGDRASITLGSVVIRDVGPGEQVTGNFALPHRAFLAHWVDSGRHSRHA